MAVEQIRGCGYRKVNSLYLVGGFVSAPCDRMPFPLTVCPICGQGIKVSRGFTKVQPQQLWGTHRDCADVHPPCFLCDPEDFPEVAFIMGIGAGHYPTPEDFIKEAQRMGVSKKIPFIPKGLVLGKTVIYLAHPKACEVHQEATLQQAMSIVEEAKTSRPRLLEAEKVEKAWGIFAAFIPKLVEKLIWKSKATPEELERLEKRGISPIIIPDGDKDHS